MLQAARTTSPITVKKRHLLIGAEVTGVDLSRPVDEPTFQAIYDAWLDNLLLVFPGQPITDAQQIAFAKRFGELEIHPSKDHRSTKHPEIYRVANVDEQGNILPPEGEAWRYLNITWLWHSDSSFRAVPSNGSILHGIEVTGAGNGGETLFCNLYAVYDALPEETKRRIDGLRVVHSHDAVLRRGQGIAKSGKYEDIPEVEQPLVRRHPVTRRKSLFISPHSMDRVVGLSTEEGRRLLDELAAFATQDRFVYRHVWAKDDIIMWDNRCTMHAVTPYDNVNVRRIMHRTTLVGDAPVIAA